jgi:hypothetical protein
MNQTMQHTSRIEANTAFLNLMAAFDEFDGSIDTAFDYYLDELERQFAECRLALAGDLL